MWVSKMTKLVSRVLVIFVIVTSVIHGNTLGNDKDCKTCCEVPKDFANGKLRTTQRRYRELSVVPKGSILQFKCDDQYVLNGEARVTCRNGVWSPQIPSCVSENSVPQRPNPTNVADDPENQNECDRCCEMPKNFTNGKVRTVSEETRGLLLVPEFTVLEFKCKKGYVLNGTNGSLCMEGAWLPVIPSCVRNSCLPPPSIEHAKPSYEDTEIPPGTEDTEFPPGTEIFYECNEGYKMVEQSPLECVRFGNNWEWAGELPHCKEVARCEDPGEDQNGEREGACCKSGDVLTYSCIENYEIMGPSAIICTETGTWNSTRPKCQPEVFCSVPDKIPDATITNIRKSLVDYYLPDDEILIVCDEGYTVGNASDQLYCDIDGTWDNDIPECKSSLNCSLPDSPQNGYIVELIDDDNRTSFPLKFEINFACYTGYRLIGDSWRSCGVYGWTNDNPTCQVIRCHEPGRPEHGWARGDDYNIGSVVSFGCHSGYNLLGSSTRMCMENGQWNGELARCDSGENHCPNPGNPIGGTKIGNRYDLGSEVTFHCDPDRILIGSPNRTCQSNGEWSGEEAKCFSQYDFDNKKAVGFKIKSLLDEEKTNQEVKISNYISALQANGSEMLDDRVRALDLNFPGHLIFVFIFDVSGSVGERNFEKSINFAKAIVKVIRVSEEGARVGAIIFSNDAHIEFNPIDYDNMQDVMQALDGIEYKKGGTATSSALALLKDRMMPLTTEVLGRNSKFIVFLMTDGKANMAGNPVHDAQALKDEKVEIYCIGITGDRKMQTLHDIATSKEEHVFILDGYESMDWLVQEIINETIDYSKCGIRQSTVIETEEEDELGRVVNGKRVLKSWPWMAIVFFVDPIDRDISKALGICGASVIDRKWILTAAHCMYKRDANRKLVERKTNELVVNLGVINIKDITNVQRAVVQYIVHPEYNRATYDYDVALIELSIPVEYNEFIRPVCLPPPDKELHKQPTFYKAGKKAAVVGWGHDSPIKQKDIHKARYVNVAKRVILTLQTRESCQNSLKNKNYVFTERMICAGGDDGEDVCRGDSGGPLMQKLVNDIGEPYWTEVGIVSWGIGCGQKDTYGFYSKVSMFVDWIKETTKKG